MFKKRYFSAHNDFKTGILHKITLIIGIALFIIYLIILGISFIFGSESSGFTNDIYNYSQSGSINTILAFSILFIGASIILYFFCCQFAKLSKIAEEIENDENLM
jgi:amino acid transporter